MPAVSERFTLLGGPLHRLGCRLGLVRDRTNPVRIGLAIGGGLWIVLVALALIDGLGAHLGSLSLVGTHVRLLAAVPLLFVCERWLDPCVAEFVAGLRRVNVVRDEAAASIETEVRRVAKWRDSWAGEAVCVALALAAPLFIEHLGVTGVSAVRSETPRISGSPLAAEWYWYVCVPAFRFLMFRWILRLVLWWTFLVRLARLDLHLVPTHPDAAGGLGYLEIVQSQFVPLVVALAAVQSASFAEQISAGRMELEATLPGIWFVLLLAVVLIVFPVLPFARQLYVCRVNGLSRYMEFATEYVSRFETKWVSGERRADDELLGSGDIQSLADVGSSVTRVQDMRVVIVSRRMIVGLAAAALLPMAPLLLFKYPLLDLAERFVRTLAGM